jgi:hypothetical protein
VLFRLARGGWGGRSQIELRRTTRGQDTDEKREDESSLHRNPNDDSVPGALA